MFADAWINLATSALAWGWFLAALAVGAPLWRWLRAKKSSAGEGTEPVHPGVHAVTPAPEPAYLQQVKRQFDRHVAQAEGSDFERACIAAAMCEIEHERVDAQRAQLSKADQLVFMIAYECAAMWCIQHGMEDLLAPEATEFAINAIRRHFAEHAWYEPEPFQRIWDQMQVFMPTAMKTDEGGSPPYPLAEMMLAAQKAGYWCDIAKLTDLAFGMHVGAALERLIGFGRYWARDAVNAALRR
jgi:hypothetical protein